VSAPDPHAVLGLPPDATPEQVAASYKRLAKRWHPDRAPGLDAQRRMAQINDAYEQLRTGPAGPAAAARAPSRPRRPRRPAGWWLPADLRRALGPELLAALQPRERIDHVAHAGDVVLAVTERRLLWVDDALVTGRVRTVHWPYVRDAETGPQWPRRRRARLRVTLTSGRRLSFGDLTPDAAEAAAGAVRAHLRAA